MIICVVDAMPTTANANPIFDGNQPVRRVHSAVVLDRRGIRRNRVLAHRGGIHSDRVSHQRASWRDPRPGADVLAEPRHGRARPTDVWHGLCLSWCLPHGDVSTTIAAPLRRPGCIWSEVKSGLLWLRGGRSLGKFGGAAAG